MTNLTASLDFHAQALNLRSERQRVIASNIANADTPGYVARDLNFAQALRQATGAASNSEASAQSARVLSTSQSGHLSGTASPTAALVESNLVYATQSQTNLDRNTVDMDRERASFADNALRYEATLRFINGDVRTALSAITGQ